MRKEASLEGFQTSSVLHSQRLKASSAGIDLSLSCDSCYCIRSKLLYLITYFLCFKQSCVVSDIKMSQIWFLIIELTMIKSTVGQNESDVQR